MRAVPIARAISKLPVESGPARDMSYSPRRGPATCAVLLLQGQTTRAWLEAVSPSWGQCDQQEGCRGVPGSRGQSLLCSTLRFNTSLSSMTPALCIHQQKSQATLLLPG